jgi:hypothetical protein
VERSYEFLAMMVERSCESRRRWWSKAVNLVVALFDQVEATNAQNDQISVMVQRDFLVSVVGAIGGFEKLRGDRG